LITSREMLELTNGYMLARCSIFLIKDRNKMIPTDNRQYIDSVDMCRYEEIQIETDKET